MVKELEQTQTSDYQMDVATENAFVSVSFNYIDGKSPDRDEYGRPTECGTDDEIKIVTVDLIEGEMPTDNEIEQAIFDDPCLYLVLLGVSINESY